MNVHKAFGLLYLESNFTMKKLELAHRRATYFLLSAFGTFLMRRTFSLTQQGNVQALEQLAVLC